MWKLQRKTLNYSIESWLEQGLVKYNAGLEFILIAFTINNRWVRINTLSYSTLDVRRWKVESFVHSFYRRMCTNVLYEYFTLWLFLYANKGVNQWKFSVDNFMFAGSRILGQVSSVFRCRKLLATKDFFIGSGVVFFGEPPKRKDSTHMTRSDSRKRIKLEDNTGDVIFMSCEMKHKREHYLIKTITAAATTIPPPIPLLKYQDASRKVQARTFLTGTQALYCNNIFTEEALIYGLWYKKSIQLK